MTVLPTVLQQAFQQLAPLTNLLWYTNQQDMPCCLVKVPQEVHFSDILVTLYTPRELDQPHRNEYGREKVRLILQYSIQRAFGQPHINQTHVFQPNSLEEWHFLTRLTQVSQILLVGYSSDSTPQYLDTRQLAWSKSKRKVLRQWLTTYLPETLRSALATQRTETHTPQIEQNQWTLPASARKSMAFPLMRALITMPEQTTDALPKIYIKVPQGTRFKEVAVAIGSLNLIRYPLVGWVFSLSLRLQDATGRILEADALGDPISDLRVLHKLTSTSSVEIVALADSPPFSVLGAKLLNWSSQKRKRAQDLFRYMRTANLSGSWKQARIHYLHEHPQGYVFQKPQESFPHTVSQRDAEVGTVQENDQLPMPHYEENILPGPLQIEESDAPHSTGAASQAVRTKPRQRILDIVGQ